MSIAPFSAPKGAKHRADVQGRRRSVARWSAIGLAAVSMVAIPIGPIFLPQATPIVAVFTGLVVILSSVSWWLTRRNKLVPAAITLTLTVWGIPTLLLTFGATPPLATWPLLFVPLCLAASTLGSRAVVPVTLLSVVTVALSANLGHGQTALDATHSHPLVWGTTGLALSLCALLLQSRATVTPRANAVDAQAELLRQRRQVRLAQNIGRMGHLLLERDRLDVVIHLASERIQRLLNCDRLVLARFEGADLHFIHGVDTPMPTRIPREQLPAFPDFHSATDALLTDWPQDWNAIFGSATDQTRLVLPLGSPTEPSGVVAVFRNANQPFDTDERAFFEAVAGLLSAAISRENALMRRALSQKMEVVGRMASGIAHDFNNLLMVVEAASHEVRSMKDTNLEELEQDLADVSERGALMTRRVLAFSKPGNDDVKTLDVDSVVASLTPMLRRLMGPSIRMTVHTEAGAGCVLASRGGFEQILMNLAVNAADAMPHGGELRVRTYRETFDGEEHLCITVADTGHGMSSTTVANIFMPFYTTKAHGTGLGLATVRDCVTEANGTIEVDSTPDVGTEFTLRFPSAYAHEPTPLSAPRTFLHANREPVLLVDDDAVVLRALGRLLRNAGYDVTEASDGKQALQQIAGGYRPKAVVTDLRMPNMGGIDLVKQLAHSQPALPCLVMTGWSEAGEEEVLEGGAQAVLRKPVEAEVLLYSLNKAIHPRRRPPSPDGIPQRSAPARQRR